MSPKRLTAAELDAQLLDLKGGAFRAGQDYHDGWGHTGLFRNCKDSGCMGARKLAFMPSGGLADVLIELAQSRSRWRWEVVVASEQETTKHSLMEQGWEPVTAFSEKDGVGVRVMLRRQVRITPDAPDAPEGGTSNAPR